MGTRIKRLERLADERQGQADEGQELERCKELISTEEGFMEAYRFIVSRPEFRAKMDEKYRQSIKPVEEVDSYGKISL